MMRKKAKTKTNASSRCRVQKTQPSTKMKPPKPARADELVESSPNEDDEFDDVEPAVNFSHQSDADAAGEEQYSEASEASGDDDFELEDKSEVRHSCQHLASMSFEELHALKEKIGLKMYKEAVFGVDRKKSKQNFKRDNKNRPREQSAKHQVPVYREVFQVKKKVHQDPRFSSRAGEFDERVFRETYSFVQDIKAKEREELAEMIRNEKDPRRRKTLKGLLQKMQNQEASEKIKTKKVELEKQYHKFLVGHKGDSKPLYLNKTEKRKIELAEKFKELKKAGKLEKYLEKKRKKNVRKERKLLPALG
ncbi:unnamed protein product [Ixodes hexagonus]